VCVLVYVETVVEINISEGPCVAIVLCIGLVAVCCVVLRGITILVRAIGLLVWCFDLLWYCNCCYYGVFTGVITCLVVLNVNMAPFNGYSVDLCAFMVIYGINWAFNG